jgi:plasmid stabilization system protein ParE
MNTAQSFMMLPGSAMPLSWLPAGRFPGRRCAATLKIESGEDRRSPGGQETGPLRMARIELAPGIRDDLDPVLDHLCGHDAEDAPGRIRETNQAIDVLRHNPLFGRPVSADTRELVIGRRARGYVAMSRCIERIDTVFVLAICGRREAG